MIIAESDKTLKIGNEAIPFALRRGKPNRVKLTFSDSVTLLIETSTGELGEEERAFVLSKRRWILKSFRARRVALDQRDQFLSDLDRAVPILGQLTPVRYEPNKKTHFNYSKEAFTIYAPAHYIKAHRRKLLFFALKEFARRYLEFRVDHWSEEIGLHYNTLRVKNLRSKWGSCSSLQNINLNWQLIFLREELLDYVIIHEFMHLREMNHSPRFWAHVEQFCPAYKELRKELKEKSWLVGILT